jgi:hypothetical protein
MNVKNSSIFFYLGVTVFYAAKYQGGGGDPDPRKKFTDLDQALVVPI